MASSQVGSRIRALREERGLTQTALAGEEMTSSYLSLIEAGKRAPSSKALRHIADVLGVEAEELLTGRPPQLEAHLELELQEARRALHRGAIDEAEETVRAVLDRAAEYGLRRVVARARTLLGTMLLQRDDPEGARVALEEALRNWENEPVHLWFESIVEYARARDRLGDPRYSIHVLERYLTRLEDEGVTSPVAEMRVRSALTVPYRRLGMPREAAAAAERALYLSGSVQEPEQLACMNMNVARVLLEEGRYSDALAAIHEAERYFQSLDWSLSIAWSRWNRGFIESQKGNFQEAHVALEGALEKLRESGGEPADEGSLLNELARVERELGDTEAALDRLRDARRLLVQADPEERGMNAFETAMCLLADDSENAESELKRAIKFFSRSHSASQLGEAWMQLGRIYRRREDIEAASEAFERGLESLLNAR